ncbi:LOW QUALITY PROTEIN: signal transducing adapter molecule 1 [Galendromus occidentalis]|uniref:LOW QUALITY PROTEIN: signal transducing adapter molecule 1 n=1 Tax=Galendromus occidentalis TaxID=34638 RepID=A0AAJ7PAM6_9ACAR|nr:LOW QUALITY PROTEIN: signal transducing adapter molecule 1 [Galendromus occidentalis]
MPIFGFGGTPIEQEIEKATKETVIKEDVSIMYELCDRVNASPEGTKEAYRCLTKRLQNPNPRVALLTLSLLDVFVMNCGKKFHLEVCSRDFTTLCKNILARGHPKVQDKLKFLLAKWVQNEFKSDPQLALIENFLQKCKSEGVQFDVQEPTLEMMDGIPKAQTQTHRQEEDDLAKAIELSLQETKKPTTSSSLYPSMGNMSSMSSSTSTPMNTTAVSNGGSGAAAAVSSKETRKVRALYDFEAAEENELSFKAGEVIIVLEDRDSNWWKGSNHRGEGLFPSNFVTSDLEAPPAEDPSSSNVIETPQVQQVTHIDEGKIDLLLQMLHDADPTALQRTEQDAKMEALDAECSLMTPLIDAELVKVDQKQASQTNLTRRLNDALAMYHQQLRQPQMPFVPPVMGIPPQIPHGVPQMPYYPPMGVTPQSAGMPPGYPVMVSANVPGGIPTMQGQPPQMMGTAPGTAAYQQDQY